MGGVKQTDSLLLPEAKFALSYAVLVASCCLGARKIALKGSVDHSDNNTDFGFFLRPGLPGGFERSPL